MAEDGEEEIKDKPVKFYFRPSFNDEIDAFLKTTPTIPSKNQLGEWAIRFYMAMYEKANGDLDRHGYPKILDALKIELLEKIVGGKQGKRRAARAVDEVEPSKKRAV